jgi:hypothetical protein
MHDKKDYVDSYERYLVFLFIYIGYSDFHLHKAEIEVILHKIEFLFPPNIDIYEELITATDYYESLTDEEIVRVVDDNFKLFYPELKKRGRIINELYDIIVADGIIKEEELAILDNFKERLNHE